MIGNQFPNFPSQDNYFGIWGQQHSPKIFKSRMKKRNTMATIK